MAVYAIFGGTEDERVKINEGTLWGGGPHSYSNPAAHTHLEETRQLIFAGKVDEAEKLSEILMGAAETTNEIPLQIAPNPATQEIIAFSECTKSIPDRD